MGSIASATTVFLPTVIARRSSRSAAVSWRRRTRRRLHPPPTIGSVIVNLLGAPSTSARLAAGEWNRSARCPAVCPIQPRAGGTPHDQSEYIDPSSSRNASLQHSETDPLVLVRLAALRHRRCWRGCTASTRQFPTQSRR